MRPSTAPTKLDYGWRLHRRRYEVRKRILIEFMSCGVEIETIGKKKRGNMSAKSMSPRVDLRLYWMRLLHIIPVSRRSSNS
jgi:hypothetical protein